MLEVVCVFRLYFVLFDVMMLCFDGIGLFCVLWGDDDLCGLLVILLLVCVGEEVSVEGFEVGVDDYVNKLFLVCELLVCVWVNL